MNKSYFLIIVSMLFLQSCEDDQCEELCSTPPQNFQFEIVDKSSGENLFTNNTFESENINITNSLNQNEPIEYRFISENNRNLLEIGSIGWKTETVDLKIYISDTPIFNFYVEAERKTGECCSYTEFHEIAITNSEFEVNSQTGIYKIFVE